LRRSKINGLPTAESVRPSRDSAVDKPFIYYGEIFPATQAEVHGLYIQCLCFRDQSYLPVPTVLLEPLEKVDFSETDEITFRLCRPGLPQIRRDMISNFCSF